MAHDRSKSEMTDTATISRTELHEREDEFGVHNERGPHARSVKMIKLFRTGLRVRSRADARSGTTLRFTARRPDEAFSPR